MYLTGKLTIILTTPMYTELHSIVPIVSTHLSTYDRSIEVVSSFFFLNEVFNSLWYKFKKHFKAKKFEEKTHSLSILRTYRTLSLWELITKKKKKNKSKIKQLDQKNTYEFINSILSLAFFLCVLRFQF